MNKEEWAKQDKSPGAKVYIIGNGGIPAEYHIESVITCGATVYRKLAPDGTDRRFQPFQALMSEAAYEAWKDKRRKAGLLFDKTCEVCGKHFETLSRTATVCSRECAYARRSVRAKGKPVVKGKPIRLEGERRIGHWTRVCITCGKEFVTDKASVKFCSDECRKEKKRERDRKRKAEQRKKRQEHC